MNCILFTLTKEKVVYDFTHLNGDEIHTTDTSYLLDDNQINTLTRVGLINVYTDYVLLGTRVMLLDIEKIDRIIGDIKGFSDGSRKSHNSNLVQRHCDKMIYILENIIPLQREYRINEILR